MIERIRSLITHLGLSTRGFAIQCGIPQNTLSNQLNGVRELSLSTITAILKSYDAVSSEWLLRGEGDMFKSGAQELNNERLLGLVDIATDLRSSIEEKEVIIKGLEERIRQLENQLNSK